MDARDDVRAAIAELGKESESEPNEPAIETAEPAGAVDAGDPGVVAPDPIAAAGVEDPPASRVRGPDGKFAKTATPAPKVEAKGATQAPVAAAPVTTPPPAAPVVTPTFKAPQSWKADVREKFAALPPEVQAEVHRRETETAQLLQSNAPAKRVHEAVAPFEAVFKAHGSDVVQALPGILQTVQQLATGRMEDKTAILGNMIRSYLGTDERAIAMLAKHLDAPQSQQPQRQQQFDPNVIVQQVEQRMAQQAKVAEVEKFAAQAEFIEDVRMGMAGIIDAAGRMGQEVSLQDAYDQACWATPSVRTVLQQRSAQAPAKAAQEAAARARAASVSVRPAPAVAPTSEAGSSVADDVRAAMADLRARK